MGNHEERSGCYLFYGIIGALSCTLFKEDCLQLKHWTQDHLNRTGWSRGHVPYSCSGDSRLKSGWSSVLLLSIYSCCSHLEHRASVKRFVSLQFLNLRQSVGLLGREISPSQGRYLNRTTKTQKKRRQTSMPRVGFEPTIPVFERAKTFWFLHENSGTAIW
jgi:hypothetical protein